MFTDVIIPVSHVVTKEIFNNLQRIAIETIQYSFTVYHYHVSPITAISKNL